jgi:hypothetical protein
VCTTCAPGDQEKSCDSQREQGKLVGQTGIADFVRRRFSGECAPDQATCMPCSCCPSTSHVVLDFAGFLEFWANGGVTEYHLMAPRSVPIPVPINRPPMASPAAPAVSTIDRSEIAIAWRAVRPLRPARARPQIPASRFGRPPVLDIDIEHLRQEQLRFDARRQRKREARFFRRDREERGAWKRRRAGSGKRLQAAQSADR